MGLFRKLKAALLPSAGADGSSQDAPLNHNSMIVNEIVYAFEESLRQLSTPRRLLFHTSYVAYVPQKYYKDLNIMFGVTTQEIAEILGERIGERLQRDKKLKYVPVYDTWSFDLIPLAEGGSDEADSSDPDSLVTYEDLEDCFVAVRSTLVPNELYDFTGIDDDEELRTNRGQPTSKYEKAQRLSMEAIKGLKPSGSGFIYPIRVPGEGSGPGDASTPGSTTRATLKGAGGLVEFIEAGGARRASIGVRALDFFVGGPSATTSYNGRPMIRVTDESVLSPHLEIRQAPGGEFEIQAIGPVSVCGIPVGRNEWFELPSRNAIILLNNEIELIFNKK